MTNKNVKQVFEATNDLFQVSLEHFGKLTSLHLANSKSAVEKASDALKNLAGATNAEEFFSHVNTLATTTVEHHLDNCRNAYEIFSETQVKLGQVVGERLQFTQLNQGDVGSFFPESFNSFKPLRSSEVVSSWLNTTSNALSRFKEVAAQTSSFTKSLVKDDSVTSTTTKKSATAAK